MKVRLVLDLEIDDSMPVSELAEGLPVTLERRSDVTSAFVRRCIVQAPKKVRPLPAPRPLSGFEGGRRG